MMARFAIPVLANILILGILGLAKNASAVSVTTCGVLSVPGETYVLSNDLVVSGNCFLIKGNNITIDGNGHTITGNDTGTGIRVDNVSGVAVQNIIIQHFAQGIHLLHVGFSTITGNTISFNSESGIVLNSSFDNQIQSNTLEDNFARGVLLHQDSNENMIIDNTVSGSLHGIQLNARSHDNIIKSNFSTMNNEGVLVQGGSNGNTLTRNTLSSNIEFGVFIGESSNNQIYYNNFIGNPYQARDRSGINNIFSLPDSIGGNFWDSFNEPVEGCDNIDNDHFCDTPLAFSGGQDNFPWIVQDGWQSEPPVANDDSVQARGFFPIGINVLSNDSDPDGDPLTITSISNGPTYGSAMIISGMVVYFPNPGIAGFDSFIYTISDGRGGEDTATVTVRRF